LKPAALAADMTHTLQSAHGQTVSQISIRVGSVIPPGLGIPPVAFIVEIPPAEPSIVHNKEPVELAQHFLQDSAPSNEPILSIFVAVTPVSCTMRHRDARTTHWCAFS
jgi:hypothetical protein